MELEQQINVTHFLKKKHMIQYNSNNWFNDHGVCGSYNTTKKGAINRNILKVLGYWREVVQTGSRWEGPLSAGFALLSANVLRSAPVLCVCWGDGAVPRMKHSKYLPLG